MDERETFDWVVRGRIYATIVERGAPPTFQEVAADLGADPDRVRSAYTRLHDRHAIYLTPGAANVRMAHPFSGVPTPFRVQVGERLYWANCAWDALGIAAALDADCCIEAETGDDAARIRLVVEASRVHGWDGVIHFALPFRRWYDDLIFT